LVTRQYWISQILTRFERVPVVWLSGVRRAGKTVLAKSLPGVEYFDCELPSVRRMIEDPESFWRGRRGLVALDEVHRLQRPSEVLKIAADHFSHLRVLATSSSTLGASARFGDTLTGRKADVWLTPMIEDDRMAFGGLPVEHRLAQGGLPGFYQTNRLSEDAVQEWIDSFWSRDIQELFRIERRASFLRLFELLFAQSGAIFEASNLAGPCEVSRGTVQNYLAVLEASLVVHRVRPFHTHQAAEIVAAPKVYGFDTGFVRALNDWRELRPSDYGVLWEHYVLNELRARYPRAEIRYWRDKQKHEVDFVVRARPAAAPTAIECKWRASAFHPQGLRAFRRRYPGGPNLVVCRDVDQPYERRFGDLTVWFMPLGPAIESLL